MPILAAGHVGISSGQGNLCLPSGRVDIADTVTGVFGEHGRICRVHDNPFERRAGAIDW